MVLSFTMAYLSIYLSSFPNSLFHPFISIECQVWNLPAHQQDLCRVSYNPTQTSWAIKLSFLRFSKKERADSANRGWEGVLGGLLYCRSQLNRLSLEPTLSQLLPPQASTKNWLTCWPGWCRREIDLLRPLKMANFLECLTKSLLLLCSIPSVSNVANLSESLSWSKHWIQWQFASVDTKIITFQMLVYELLICYVASCEWFGLWQGCCGQVGGTFQEQCSCSAIYCISQTWNHEDLYFGPLPNTEVSP